MSASEPIIVAHRGASADAPENTISAFALAWKQGADAIEGDFHLTRDRQIVCIHDDTTSKTSNHSLKVRKTRLSHLQSLDVGSWKSPEFSSERIPTLGNVLATVPADKKIYIEIKSSPKIVRHLLKILDASDLSNDQIVIIAFSPRVVKKVKSLRPSLTVNLLSGVRRSAKGEGLDPSSEQLLAQLRRSKADGLGIYAHPDIDSRFVQPILDAGFALHVWTVDDPEVARKWIEFGASSITTNTPAKLGEAL